MLKGLIGKKVGMTQIFDDCRICNSGHAYRSWAMLRYPDYDSLRKMAIQRSNWVSVKQSRNASAVVSWVI